jgi:hypothetical protein
MTPKAMEVNANLKNGPQTERKRSLLGRSDRQNALISHALLGKKAANLPEAGRALCLCTWIQEAA